MLDDGADEVRVRVFLPVQYNIWSQLADPERALPPFLPRGCGPRAMGAGRLPARHRV